MNRQLFQPDFVRVKDDKNLIRDTSNNAILAAGVEEKRKYMEAQQKELLRRKTEEDSVKRMEKIETDLKSLKDMLVAVLNKLEHPAPKGR